MRPTLMLAIAMLLLLIGCTKTEEEGCSNSANDATWRIQGDLEKITHCPVWINGGTYNSIGFKIEKSSGGTIKEDIITITWEGSSTGTFDLAGISTGSHGLYSGSYNNYANEFTGPGKTGELTITKYDLDNGEISGTFWFQVNITTIEEGRFRDVKLE